MWYREDVKERARRALRNNGYWSAVLAAMIVLVLTTGAGFGGDSNIFYRFHGISQDEYIAEAARNLPLAAWFWGAMAALGLAWSILVAIPLEVGTQRFFLEHRVRRVSPWRLFLPFRRGYGNAVKAMFMKSLIVLGWTLLFIIPGVVKGYQYYYVSAILADNPDIPWRRALKLSRDMTQGHKMEIWIMELSFLGWELLALIVVLAGLYLMGPMLENIIPGLFRQFCALTRMQPAAAHYGYLNPSEPI